MTDAEIVARMFGSPCDYNFTHLDVNKICNCENECGSEKTPVKCWQKYFDWIKKNKEDKK